MTDISQDFRALDAAAHRSAPRNRADFEQATALPKPGSRSPQEWEPLGPITLNAGVGVQIAPRRPGRDEVLVTNTGATNSALIYRRAAGSGAAPIRYITLSAGQSFTASVECPLYGYSASGTTLEVSESFYDLGQLSQRTWEEVAEVGGMHPDEHNYAGDDTPGEPVAQPPIGTPLLRP